MRLPSGRTLLSHLLSWSALALAFALPSCGKTWQLTDTEGRQFTVECKGDCGVVDMMTKSKPQELRQQDAIPGAQPGYTLLGAELRYLVACEAWVASDDSGRATIPAEESCRVLTCKTDADCPALTFHDSATCLSGLCGSADMPLTAGDIRNLCLSGTKPGSEERRKARALTHEACPNGKNCTLPEACRP